MQPLHPESDLSVHSWMRGEYTISTDRSLLDLDVIHGYLTRSYWSPGIPRGIVARAIVNSFCFGLYAESQIGFARVVTDCATYAYLCDLFVLPGHQGHGLGMWLVDCILHAPPLAGIRTFTLATRDAHGLYEKFGFQTVTDGARLMFVRHEMPWYRPELAETHGR